jgi:DNA-binding transcriptional MerR regulator
LVALRALKWYFSTSSQLQVKGFMVLDISEVSKRSGVSSSALRFYEEKGLIASVGRKGLRRLFNHSVVERLALIGLGRAAGFSLDAMKSMFAVDGPPQIDRTMLEAKADEIEKTIRQLSAMRDGLRHAASCSAPSHFECPTFCRLMRAAAIGVIEAPIKKTPRPKSV